MIALDTSVLVRYLTDDPPALSARARDLIDSADRLGVSSLVLLEAAHVLRTQYDVSRPDVLAALLELVTLSNVEVLDLPTDTVVVAMARARELGAAPLADALVVASAREAGAEAIATFDQGIRRHGLPVVEP